MPPDVDQKVRAALEKAGMAAKVAIEAFTAKNGLGSGWCGFAHATTYDVTSPYVQYLLSIELASGPFNGEVLSREWLEFEGGVISRMFNRLSRRANAEGDYAMEQNTTKSAADATAGALFNDWFDPIEVEVRRKVRGFIETMIEEELSAALRRPRYGRGAGSPP